MDFDKDNIKILNEIKEISTLGDTDLMTVQMVADYYEVSIDTISRLILRNKKELENKGLKVLNYKETKELLLNNKMSIINKKGYFECQGQKFANRKNTFINKESLVIIGLLLTNSHIANKFKNKLQINYNLFIRKEIAFIDQLEQVLLPLGIEGIRQYPILNYRIDYYIPDLKIAIEYDENDHIDYDYNRQEGRQQEIEKELNCNFIRVSDKKDNEYNIGFIMNEILDIVFNREAM